MDAKPKRRRFRFSLRTLIVFVTVASAGFGWLGIKVREANRQKEAVEAMQKLGGFVKYDYEFFDVSSAGATWLRKRVGDDFFADVGLLSLEKSRVTDAGLVDIRGLPNLEILSLNNTQVSSAGLMQLRGLTRLEALFLTYTPIADAGLEHLEGLVRLKTLSLADTQVTDAGLVHLKGLTQLETLHLSNTPVTDAGLVRLRQLTNLQQLFLNGTQVTDKGCDELQKALPNLKIIR